MFSNFFHVRISDGFVLPHKKGAFGWPFYFSCQYTCLQRLSVALGRLSTKNQLQQLVQCRMNLLALDLDVTNKYTLMTCVIYDVVL